MPFDDILCSWLVRSALVSLTILLFGSGAVLIWRQPLRRVRIIELVLAGCLIAPWLGLIPGYPQLSLVASHSPVIQKPEAPLPPSPEPMIEPAMTEPMPLPVLDRATPESSDTKPAEAPVHAFEIRAWIVGIYLAGVAIGTGWWLVGIAGLARLLWSSQHAPSRCRELLAEISGGRSDRVRLLVSRHLNQPFASAWGRAVIVLPENLCGDEQALRWCLAHEWAHVDGRDFRSWLLAGLARVLFFYQPLLWWLRRQLRLCQDFVADSQAARHAPEVEDYAEFLTSRAAGRLHPALGLSMGCHKSELYRRVIMLLKNESLESRIPRLWTVSVTVIALVLVGVVAAVSLVPRAVAEEKQAVSQAKEVGDKTKEMPKELTVSPAKELTVDLGKGIKLEMVLIPAGEFMMGSPDSEKIALPSERPQHRVHITKPFYLGKYLVTQEQWEAVMGYNPSRFKGPKNPVEMVSWEDCQQFLEKIDAKIGVQGEKFLLPSEAQWEYASRAGSTTRFYFGNKESALGEYAWYDGNSDEKTHPVGEKKPNGWGLYDIYGNVWEWCQDWYDSGYYANSPTDDPSGPTAGKFRVNRGGSYYLDDGYCSSTYRYDFSPGIRRVWPAADHSPSQTAGLGFRVARVSAESAAATHSPSGNDQSGKTSAAPPKGDESNSAKAGAKAEEAAQPKVVIPRQDSTADSAIRHTIRFHFFDRPLKDVLQSVAKQAGLPLETDNTWPEGTFNYSDNRQFTLDEAIDIMNVVLASKNYTLLRPTGWQKIVLVKGLYRKGAPHISEDTLDSRGDQEFVIVVFDLGNANFKELKPRLMPLLSSNGSWSSRYLAPPIGTELSVIDLAGHVKKIRDAINVARAKAGKTVEPKSAAPTGSRAGN